MTAYLMASRPGAFTKEGLIVGNPEVVANAVVPTGSYPLTPDLAVAASQKSRLLSIVTDAAIDVIQAATGETSANAAGAATRIPAPSSGLTSYACLLHPSTVGVYVKSA